AALLLDWAATPALPLADGGKMRATLTCALPMAVLGCVGGGGAPLQKLLPGKPEQPAASAASPAATASKARRVARERNAPPCDLPDTAALLMPVLAPVLGP